MPHEYSYGAGLLHDTAGSTTYTPGVSQRKDGTDLYFHEDWIGSSRYLSDGTGASVPTAYRYDAYGNTSAQAGPDVTSRKFTAGMATRATRRWGCSSWDSGITTRRWGGSCARTRSGLPRVEPVCEL